MWRRERIRIAGSLFQLEFAAFAAGFVDKPQIVNPYAAVYRFDHVIEGEGGIGNGDKRFHFDSRFADIFGGARDLDLGVSVIGVRQVAELNLDIGEQEGMAHGNQFVRAFCRHDARHACDGKHIPFFKSALGNQGTCWPRHDDDRFGNRDAFRVQFGAYIDHLGASLRIEMGQHDAELYNTSFVSIITRMAALKVLSEKPERIVLGRGGGNAVGALIGTVVFGVITCVALFSILGEGGNLSPVMIFIFIIIGFVLVNSVAKTLSSTRVVLDAGQSRATRTDALFFLPMKRQEMAFNLIRDVQVTRLAGSGDFSLDTVPIWLVQLHATDGSSLIVNERGKRAEMDALAQRVSSLLNRPVRGAEQVGAQPAQAVTYAPAAVISSLFGNLSAFTQSVSPAEIAPPIAASSGGGPRMRPDEFERTPHGQRRKREPSPPPAPPPFPDTPTSTVRAVNSDLNLMQVSTMPAWEPGMGILTNALTGPQIAFTAAPVLVMPELPGMLTFAPALELPAFPAIGGMTPMQMAGSYESTQVKVVEAQVEPAGYVAEQDMASSTGDALKQYRAGRQLHAARHYADAQGAYLRALGASPAEAAIHNDLGVAYYKQNKVQDAERAFRRAVALDPFSPSARFNLGMLLQRSGRKREAQEQFKVGAQNAGQENAEYYRDALRGNLSELLLSPEP